jgi:hypothetical protein
MVAAVIAAMITAMPAAIVTMTNLDYVGMHSIVGQYRSG